jgi:hypothetical protein
VTLSKGFVFFSSRHGNRGKDGAIREQAPIANHYCIEQTLAGYHNSMSYPAALQEIVAGGCPGDAGFSEVCIISKADGCHQIFRIDGGRGLRVGSIFMLFKHAHHHHHAHDATAGVWG